MVGTIGSGGIRASRACSRAAFRAAPCLGEIGEFGSQFLSFGMSFTARHLEAIYLYSMQGRSRRLVLRGDGYPLTVGAAFYQQVLNVLNGKDPEDMTTFDFWGRAFIKGGGGGLFTDFVNRAENRFGQSFAETLPGPGAAFIGNSVDLTLRTIRAIIPGGEDQKLGRHASKYVGRYTPILASHPATRMWYRRAFVDQLQWLTDPDADKSFHAQKGKSSMWWEPGEMTFNRLPAPDAALGSE